MVLNLLPILVEDFVADGVDGGVGDQGVDLSCMPVSTCWPVIERSEAEARRTFHMSRQRHRFLHDRSVRFTKILDTTDNSVITIARWHHYLSGYSYE